MLRETCHCTHDRSSHYCELGTPTPPGACLCSGCDCTKYAYEGDPKPEPEPERPATHKGACQCYWCKKWRAYIAALPPSVPVRDERPTLPAPAPDFGDWDLYV